MLEEYLVPEGYTGLRQNISFSIVLDGSNPTGMKVQFNGGEQQIDEAEVAYNAAQGWFVMSVDNKLITYVLPETGGPGELLFIIGGLALMAGAAVAFWRRRIA